MDPIEHMSYEDFYGETPKQSAERRSQKSADRRSQPSANCRAPVPLVLKAPSKATFFPTMPKPVARPTTMTLEEEGLEFAKWVDLEEPPSLCALCSEMPVLVVFEVSDCTILPFPCRVDPDTQPLSFAARPGTRVGTTDAGAVAGMDTAHHGAGSAVEQASQETPSSQQGPGCVQSVLGRGVGA